MMCAVSLGATAQSTITYPYNPDEDGNGQIAVADLQGILSTYGNAFAPSEILVDGEALTTVLTQLQNSIDSLSGLTGVGGSVLDMPLGTVLPIATESVPEGWMLCDGREISIEEYQDLYDLIGTTYGAGDSAFWAQVFFPATTFNIPDLRGRTIIGADGMGGEAAGVILHHGALLGQSGGEERHQLTEEEIPEHHHDFIAGGFGNSPGVLFQPNDDLGTVFSTSSVGGDQPHNNMQPYMVLNYMIKAVSSADVVGQLTELIADQQEQLDSLGQSVLEAEVMELSIECVDMGVSPLCPSLGLSESAILGPGPNGFSYSLTAGQSLDEENFSLVPNWRKFEILGCDASQLEGVVLRYGSRNDYYGGYFQWREQTSLLTPEVDSEGRVFIYFYGSCSSGNNDCADELFYDIPLSAAFRAKSCGQYSSYYDPQTVIEIGLVRNGAIQFTGLAIDF